MPGCLHSFYGSKSGPCVYVEYALPTDLSPQLSGGPFIVLPPLEQTEQSAQAWLPSSGSVCPAPLCRTAALFGVGRLIP